MVLFNSVTSLILQFTIFFIIIYYLIFIYQNRQFFKFAWKNKSNFVPVLPIVGITYAFLFIYLLNGFQLSPFSAHQTLMKYFSLPANLWIGHFYHYVTNDPSEIKIILNHPKCNDKGIVYQFVNRIFKNSILVVPHDEWKRRRRYFQASFKPSVLKQQIPSFYKNSCQLLKDLSMLKDDVFDLFCEYSFTNFFCTTAGLQPENMTPDILQIGNLLSRIQKNGSVPIFYPFIPKNLLLNFSSVKKLIDDELKVRAIALKLIQEKKAQNCSQQDSPNKDETITLLDLIIRDPNLTESDMIEEMSFFIAAGTETTGLTLSCCVTILGMYPEIQEILYNEVVDIVGFNEILNVDLPNLIYVEAVILETLRLFPAVPFISRCARGDVDLGNKVIPKGSNIIIDIFQLQRDEKYWPNPLKFDPTRYLFDNRDALRESKILFSFSAGPKDCLGKAQAMAMMKITIAMIIRKYKVSSKFKSLDDFVLTSTVTMQPLKPLDCQFTLRAE